MTDWELVNDFARCCATEIINTFDINTHRGINYFNTKHETIAIIIAQQFKKKYEELKNATRSSL